MAVGRQLNTKGQMRIDVPHLRLIESGVVYDFDTLAGGILAGKLPYVVTGFTPNAWVNGSAASSLSLVTAGSIFVNYNASENGSMLMVPADRAPEPLTVVNSRVVGGFTVSQSNYVSLDLVRLEDDSTSDVVHFIDPATGQSTPKIIPLGRTMDYRIHISTTPFSATPQLCPVMIVDTDANNNIVSVEDARPMMYRLASGGDSPNPLGVYSWPQGRTESANSFIGGDKAITNMKDWASAIMQRIWELTGGEYWYSDVTDRNLKVYADNTDSHTRASITNNQIWDGTDITWSGFGIAFDNSTAYINEIQDQTTPSPGLTNLAAGECIYVDYDRSTNHLRAGTPLVAHKTTLSNLGTPAKPGVRVVLFWRPDAASKVYSRLDFTAVGQYSGAATTTTYGVVKLSSANAVAGGPYVAPIDSIGRVVAQGLTRGAIGSGALDLGTDPNDASIHLGSPFCNYLEISSGGTVGTVLTSQKNISIESGVTTNVGQTIIESKQGILIGTTTNQPTITIGRSGSTTQATSIYGGFSLTLSGQLATNISTGVEGDITIGKSNATTQLTKLFGKTVYINTVTAGSNTIIGNGNGGTSTAIYGNTINIAGLITINGSNVLIPTTTSFSSAKTHRKFYHGGNFKGGVSGGGIGPLYTYAFADGMGVVFGQNSGSSWTIFLTADDLGIPPGATITGVWLWLHGQGNQSYNGVMGLSATKLNGYGVTPSMGTTRYITSNTPGGTGQLYILDSITGGWANNTYAWINVPLSNGSMVVGADEILVFEHYTSAMPAAQTLHALNALVIDYTTTEVGY